MHFSLMKCIRYRSHSQPFPRVRTPQSNGFIRWLIQVHPRANIQNNQESSRTAKNTLDQHVVTKKKTTKQKPITRGRWVVQCFEQAARLPRLQSFSNHRFDFRLAALCCTCAPLSCLTTPFYPLRVNLLSAAAKPDANPLVLQKCIIRYWPNNSF